MDARRHRGQPDARRARCSRSPMFPEFVKENPSPIFPEPCSRSLLFPEPDVPVICKNKEEEDSSMSPEPDGSGSC